MNKTAAKISIALLAILAVGILIPKFTIKNPDLSSSPCATMNYTSEVKFPAWLIMTPKVESFTISSIDINYYTLFGIKTGKHRITFCTLAK